MEGQMGLKGFKVLSSVIIISSIIVAGWSHFLFLGSHNNPKLRILKQEFKTGLTKLKNSTVVIFNRNSMGSGVIIHNGKFPVLLSNAHVCADSKNNYKVERGALAIIKSKRRIIKLKTFPLLDRINDLCIYKLPKKYKYDYIELADEPAKIFEPVLLSTYKNKRIGRLYYDTTVGAYMGTYVYDILTLSRSKSQVTTHTVIPGMSGSPIVNKNGKLVMLVKARLSSKYKETTGDKNLGLSVSYDAIKRFLVESRAEMREH